VQHPNSLLLGHYWLFQDDIPVTAQLFSSLFRDIQMKVCYTGITFDHDTIRVDYDVSCIGQSVGFIMKEALAVLQVYFSDGAIVI